MESPAVPGPLRATLLQSVTNLTAPSSSPTVFFTAAPPISTSHTPLMFRPLSDTIQIKEEPVCTPSPLHQSLPRSFPSSSDTEDDSQGKLNLVHGDSFADFPQLSLFLPQTPAQGSQSSSKCQLHRRLRTQAVLMTNVHPRSVG